MEMRKEEVEGKHFPFKNLMGKLHISLLPLPQWSELGCIHPKLGGRLGYIVPTIRISSTPMVLTTSGMFSVPTTNSLILLTLTGCSTIRFDPDSNKPEVNTDPELTSSIPQECPPHTPWEPSQVLGLLYFWPTGCKLRIPSPPPQVW